MQKLPDGFIRALANTESPTIFSPPEYKPVIKHLLANKKKEKFVLCMNKLDYLFNNYENHHMYGDKSEDCYYGQWMNFLFIIVVSVCYYTKSSLSLWKIRVNKAEELQKQLRNALEGIKVLSEEAGKIFKELDSFPNTDDLRPPSEMNSNFATMNDLVDVDSLVQIIAQIDDYRATDGFYGHYKIPANVGEFNTYLEYFFKRLESQTRIGVINPDVMDLGHAFWRDVLKGFPGLYHLTNENIKKTRGKLKNLSC